MIELALLAAVASIGAAYAGLRRLRGARAMDPAESVKPSSRDDVFPLGVGDVVLLGSDERWLTSVAWLADGARPVAALFFASEGADSHAVAAFPLPRRAIFALQPTAIDGAFTLPSTLEVDGVSFSRTQRIPVTLKCEGEGAPPLDPSATFAVYESGPKEVVIVLGGEHHAVALRGIRLGEMAWERLGREAPDS